MSRVFANFFGHERQRRGWNFGKFARQVAPLRKRLEKLMRQLVALEREGHYTPELLEMVFAALGTPVQTIQSLLEHVDVEQEQWLDEPVTMLLVLRLGGSKQVVTGLDRGQITQRQALGFASLRCKELGCHGSLLLSRRQTVRLSADGRILSIDRTSHERSDAPRVVFRDGRIVRWSASARGRLKDRE